MLDWSARLADLASYRPSDFVMFAPRTYWRLFELHNEAWWPLPVLLPAVGITLAAWVGRGGALAARVAGLALAAGCVFVAFAFVRVRYQPINWAAGGLFALLLLLAALLLLLVATMSRPDSRVASSDGGGDRRRRRVALLLAAWALVGQPFVAPLGARPLVQAEVVALAPDPTLFAVLAWLWWVRAAVAARAGPVRWAWRVAAALALGGVAAAGATLATMLAPEAVAPLGVVVLTAASLWRWRRR